jgi:hypothetical protein
MRLPAVLARSAHRFRSVRVAAAKQPRRGNEMAELTALESKIGEVLGLAMAAQEATRKVTKLVEQEGNHEDLGQALQQMAREAKETEERTTDLASELEGKKTAILEKARETKQEATKMMSTYLGDDADALDGFEFLTMAEAGEVGHWQVVGTMNRRAQVAGLHELVEWVTPIQQRHFQQTLEGSVELAGDEDPNEPA